VNEKRPQYDKYVAALQSQQRILQLRSKTLIFFSFMPKCLIARGNRDGGQLQWLLFDEIGEKDTEKEALKMAVTHCQSF